MQLGSLSLVATIDDVSAHGIGLTIPPGIVVTVGETVWIQAGKVSQFAITGTVRRRTGTRIGVELHEILAGASLERIEALPLVSLAPGVAGASPAALAASEAVTMTLPAPRARLRIALTETRNAFSDMPARVEDLGRLAPRLEDLRRANVDHHRALIADAAAAGAQAIGLGELFVAPYFGSSREPMWHALAESAEDGPTVRALAEAAAQHRLVIVAPIYEQAPSGRRYNTAVVIDADGAVLGKYRKTHIPHGENEQGQFVEPFYFGPADEPLYAAPTERVRFASPHFPVFRTAVGWVGVAICYDRHFEGVMRTLKAGGAELVFVPSVTFGAKSERMWEAEFGVDAARHGLFIAGSNRLGAEPPYAQPYFGRSHVVGPNGRAPALPSPRPELVLAEIDLAELRRPDPAGWDLPRDRRLDIYV